MSLTTLSIEPPNVKQQSVFSGLSNLPAPDSAPIIVGVYDFSDQTGQRLVTSNQGSGLSTAIPQGLSSLLVQELLRAGGGEFYRVVEREHVGALLNERSIVTNALGVEGAAQLGPLLLPGILITGGAVSYDRSVGQQLQGLGVQSVNATREIVTDQVGIVLRAVSVKSGEVMATVYAQKSVKSARVGLSGLRVLDTDVLALEVGSATNEPVSLAVRMAIAAGVLELTKEGFKLEWWIPAPLPP